MQHYFKRFFVLHSSEVIFSFLIKKSSQKVIEIEIAFFQSLGNPTGRTLDHLQSDTYIDELVELFLTLSMKALQVDLIFWTTLAVPSWLKN